MDEFDLDDELPTPVGELALQTIAMPANTNANGDIFAGWLLSQMDLAAAIAALKVTSGRVTTVAVGEMAFLTPVHVGAVVSCYAEVKEVGRSSIRISVEVWIGHRITHEPTKVTEGEFIFVAIDDAGRTRRIS